MNVLFISDRERFWAHFVPVMMRLREQGHHVEAAMAPGKTFAHLERVVNRLNNHGINDVHWWSPAADDLRVWLARIVWHRKWSAVVICPEHLTPMRWVKSLLCAVRKGFTLKGTDRRPPVITMQHGLRQHPPAETPEWCDHFMVWGALGKKFIGDVERRGVNVHITGTPRFDQFLFKKTEDKGFVLAVAGHVANVGSRLTVKWLDRVQAMCPADREIVVKVHPNDPDFILPSGYEGIRFVCADEEPWGLLRTCHALYLDYLSTYWLEATCLGKPIILDGTAKEYFGPPANHANETKQWNKDDVLKPGDSTGRIIEVIKSVANNP